MKIKILFIALMITSCSDHNNNSNNKEYPVVGVVTKIDSNRQKQDKVYFHDCGASIVRPHCIENVHQGLLPQKWMGKKIYPLTQIGGLDIDYPYELPLAENWLKEKGFTEEKLPYKKIK